MQRCSKLKHRGVKIFLLNLWLGCKNLLNDTLKAFNDFKNKQESVWSNDFWYVKLYIFWKCIQNTIHCDKTQMLKKFLRAKETVQKMSSFFFRELQLITILFLIFDSYIYELKHKVHLSKTVWDFPFSIPVRFYWSLHFWSTKRMDCLTLKCHGSFQNQSKRKATHSFVPRPLIFKLQREVLKFNDTCVSWSSQNLTWGWFF